MATRRPQLAKLTRPRLHKAVARERLFALLDEARQHKPAICVVGPPGAGKTTLVASWLDARGIKGIWYQVDTGDADLATFFYYLGEAAKPSTRKGQRPLPLLTPEYLQDVEGFSRRFFRDLFARMPEDATLVLDNYQEVAPDQPFHRLIARAVSEIPPGIMLVVISRGDPPDSYAKLIANDNVALIEWDELKFTLDEACEIGGLRQPIGRVEMAKLHQASNGWAAGLVLLLEQQRRGTQPFDGRLSDSLNEVFGYFTSQLVEQFDPATLRLLAQMSYLPRLTTPMAVAITGTPSAGTLLEELHRRHLFTDRRAAQEPVYQFHALFQAFLQRRSEQVLSAGERTATALHAARLLEEAGRVEEAVPLALTAGDAEVAIAMILRHAAGLIGQARWRVVVDWIAALPPERVTSDCWLLHWQGSALIAVDPPRARALLESSFRVAEAQADDACQVQAAAGVIQTLILEYTKFQPMDLWIEVLQSRIAKGVMFAGVDAELRVQSALLVALAYRQPHNPGVAACAQRVFVLLQSDAEPNLRTISAAYLVVFGLTTGPLEFARRTRLLLERLIVHPEVTVLTAGWGRFILAYSHCVIWNGAAGREAVANLEHMGQDNDLSPLVRLAAIIGAHVEIGTGRLDLAEAWADKLDRVTGFGKPYDEGSSANLRVYLALHTGQTERAIEPAKKALALFDEAGTYFHRTLARVNLAVTHVLLGDLASGEMWTHDAMGMGDAMQGWLKAHPYIVMAQIALERGEQASVKDYLAKAFAFAREIDCVWPFICLKPLMPRLCAIAMESDIERDFTRKVIRELALPAPVHTIDKWPWPIRIYTLGRHELRLDDKPLAFSHKTPKKPIALLKAIVALGGRDVVSGALCDALWPELEGDAAEEALDQTLHRLRRLLASTEAVQLEDGKLRLNDALVWADVRAFEELLAAGTGNGDAHEAIFDLYRGEFLADEPEAPWAVSLRERLRGKFVHYVEQAGARLESAQRWHQAIELYLRGVDADALNEAFYQGLMRCYAGLGNRAEALSVYRRLRQQLSVVLGMQPSASSESLARDLRLQ